MCILVQHFCSLRTFDQIVISVFDNWKDFSFSSLSEIHNVNLLSVDIYIPPFNLFLIYIHPPISNLTNHLKVKLGDVICFEHWCHVC